MMLKILLVTLLSTSSVHASPDDNFQNACSGSNQAVNTQAACASAKTAKQTSKTESAKLVIFTAAAVTAGVFAAMQYNPITASAGVTGCKAVGIATPITTTAADIATQKEQEAINRSLLNGVSSLAPVAAGAAIGTIGKAGKQAAKTTTEEGAKEGAKEGSKEGSTKADKVSCIASVAAFGASAGQSAMSMKAAGGIYEDSVNLAGNLSMHEGQTIKPSFEGADPNSKKLNDKNTQKPDSVAGNDCAGLSGNAYLDCIKKTDPEINRMLGHPEFVNELTKKIGGKNLGDFLKNAPVGNVSATAGYVASNMNLGSNAAGVIEKAIQDGEKLASLKGMTPSNAYAGNFKGSRALAGMPNTPDVDYNKLLADMMKAMGLNPETATEEQKQAAAESMFRQLELLPPEKIEANRDISLFVRIGFRYRKNLPQLDSLGWSLESNQRAPANYR